MTRLEIKLFAAIGSVLGFCLFIGGLTAFNWLVSQ